MNDSFISTMVTNFIAASLALPIIFLGLWLSTKSWYFFSLVVLGNAWIAFVITNPVYTIWINPSISTPIKLMSWSLPIIFFVVTTIVAIREIKTIKETKEVKE